MREALAVLIPAHNDDYTLPFCLDAVLGLADEVVVLDDCSTDRTPEIGAYYASACSNVRYVRHEGAQLGWIGARNRLLELTDARHLLWLDADDVLADDAAPDLLTFVRSARSHVMLRLCELWGDLRHTTQRWRHLDRCHCYVDRRRYPYMRWAGRDAARLVHVRPAGPSDRTLAFHLKGVKSDRRLVERQCIRRWLRGGRTTASVIDHAALDDLSREELHARALRTLLHSRQDHVRQAYSYETDEPLDGAPPLPAALRACGHRFRFQYVGDRIIDRIDSQEAS